MMKQEMWHCWENETLLNPRAKLWDEKSAHNMLMIMCCFHDQARDVKLLRIWDIAQSWSKTMRWKECTQNDNDHHAASMIKKEMCNCWENVTVLKPWSKTGWWDSRAWENQRPTSSSTWPSPAFSESAAKEEEEDEFFNQEKANSLPPISVCEMVCSNAALCAARCGVHRVRPATVAAAVPTPTIAFHRWLTRVQLLPAGNCPHPDNPDGVGIPDMALENCILPFVCDYKSLYLSVSTTVLRTLVSSPVSHLSLRISLCLSCLSATLVVYWHMVHSDTGIIESVHALGGS